MYAYAMEIRWIHPSNPHKVPTEPKFLISVKSSLLHLSAPLFTTITVSLKHSYTMSGKKSNIALLTEGASYIQRAKKARQDQVAEIKFDDEARRSVLPSLVLQRCLREMTDDVEIG